MKHLLKIAAVILGLASMPASAGLNGDTVDIMVPNQPDQTGLVVGAGTEAEFNYGSDESIHIDVTDTTIHIWAEDHTGIWQWETGPVVVTVTDLDFGSPFHVTTSVTPNALDPVTWDYGSNWVSASFSDYIDYSNYEGALLDITATLVPEPTAVPTLPFWAILTLAGLVPLIAQYYRRRRKAEQICK